MKYSIWSSFSNSFKVINEQQGTNHPYTVLVSKRKVQKGRERKSSRLPCKLLEYFQATPAIDNAPIALPLRPKLTASRAVFSC